MYHRDNFYVVSGGPGAGKTTLLNVLAKKGYIIIPEDARRIISEQMQVNGDALPWKNKTLYTWRMLNASVNSFREAALGEAILPVFFDRGIPDALCYATMSNIDITPEMNRDAATCRYNKNVFLLPPWKKIYHTDNERKQTWEEAVFTFHKMKETYISYGYTIIEIPEDAPGNRAEFVIQHLIASEV